MSVRSRRLVKGLLFLPAPFAARAQAPAALPRLLPESEEVALALEAAPPNVGERAEVWVLRRGGHVKVRDGSSGFACLVSRDHAESLYPICYDAEAARTILPVQVREQQLREQGKPTDEIAREIGLAYRDGTFRPPVRGAMAYMMSPRQVIYSNGRRVGQWRSHLMLYLPYATSAELGIDKTLEKNVFMMNPGAPNAHLIIVMSDWSKPPETAAAPAR